MSKNAEEEIYDAVNELVANRLCVDDPAIEFNAKDAVTAHDAVPNNLDAVITEAVINGTFNPSEAVIVVDLIRPS